MKDMEDEREMMLGIDPDSDSGAVSGDGDGGSGDHDLFERQMTELNSEREGIFGINPEDGELGLSREDLSEAHSSATMEDIYADREAQFGFTDGDISAWSGGSSSTHSADFMEAVRAAREAAEAQVSDRVEEQMVEEEVVPQVGTFTHLTPRGDSVSMVDVGSKVVTRRTARARSVVVFPPEVMQAFDSLTVKGELIGPKGPIFATAKVAGIMGAKKTSELIPLCHPLPIDKVHIDITLEGNKAVIECECRVTHKTGVEMEALTGATVAALTIYDMVKAVSHEIQIVDTCLLSKSGGKRNVGPSN